MFYKTAILTSICLMASMNIQNAFGKQLNSFNDLNHAIKQGKKISITYELNNCSLSSNFHMNEYSITGMFIPDKFMSIDNKKIVTSSTHFTLNNPHYKNIPIYEYSTYKFFPNYTMRIKFTALNASTMQPIDNNSFSAVCNLNSAVRVFAD